MVIGVILSGIMAGVLGTVGALTMGLPLWGAILLYPIVGTIGSISFISVSMRRGEEENAQRSNGFATEIR